MNDTELLKQYIAGSQDAFAELTERYAGLVYSACMRKLTNHHLAEEASQAVFIVLARKAGSLPEGTVLAGWLVKTAYFAAMNLIRTESRRKDREQEVSVMKNGLTEEEKKVWAELSPHLDEALLSLNETDRNAVVLRFFQNKTNDEIGTELNMKPGTVSTRISRALDKLKKIFSKKGVTVSAAVLSAVLAQNAVQAAPAGVAATCTAAAAGTAALSNTLSNTVQGVITMIIWTKTKIAMLMIALSALITALTGTAAAYKINADRGKMEQIISEKEDQIQGQEQRIEKLEETVRTLSQQADTDLDRIADLENTNWDLEKKLSQAKAPRPVGKQPAAEELETPEETPLPAEGDTKAEKEETGDFLKEYAKMMTNPEMKEMMKQQTKMTLPMFYKGLYESLNLTPEEKQQMDDLITERKIEEMMIGFKLMAEGSITDEGVDAEVAKNTAKTKDKIKNLLGEDRYTTYTEYEENLMNHLAISQLEQKLASTDYPLLGSQKTQLLQILKEENEAMKEDKPESMINNFDSISWDKEQMDKHFARQEKLDEKILLRTSNFLTPQQVEEYRTFLENQRKMARTQLEMGQKMLKSKIKQESGEN